MKKFIQIVFLLIWVLTAVAYADINSDLATHYSFGVITHDYYIPVFKPKPGNWSGLGISNLNTKKSANITTTIYSKKGISLGSEIKTIPAGGQDSFMVGSSLSNEGWIKITSDQPLAGLNLLGQYKESSTDYYLADVPFTDIASKSLLIPHVAQNPNWDTTVYIANTESSSGSVTLTYTNKNGVAATPYLITIPGNGTQKIPVSTIGKSTAIYGGYVTITSTKAITAFALYNNLKTGNYSYAGINAVDNSSIDSMNSVNDYYIPVFKPKPWNWSGLGISNLNSKIGAKTTTTIYSKTGISLGSETKTIPAGGQDRFMVGSSLSSEGWIKITSDQPLAGLNLLGQCKKPSTTEYYLADVPFTNIASRSLLIPHVAQNPKWDTTVYIANTKSSSGNVTLTYTNKNGVAATPYIVTIPGNGAEEIPVSTIGKSTAIYGGYVTITSTKAITAFALYNNLKTGNYSYAGINAVPIAWTGDCGAYIAPGVWKIFDCYNLAAIGKTTTDDPFTPSWRLIGGYWQWGRKGPSSSQWHTTNTPNFAHGPSGSEAGDANHAAIKGWDTAYAPDGAWSDTSKTANDPCPAGFRVPTKIQWDGVIDNNTRSIAGTWSDSSTNYSSARFFGDDLMLPAAGFRYSSSGALNSRGYYGYYWSSSQYPGSTAWLLYFSNSSNYTVGFFRGYGYSVRCIAE